MKTLNEYIVEKFKISKDIEPDKQVVYLNYNEFISKLNKDLDGGQNLEETRKMMVDKCFPSVNLNKYDYLYLDKETYGNKFGYKIMFDWCEKLLTTDDFKQFNIDKRLYVDNIIHLYVYYYIDVNLSGDEGDEHYIFFIDRLNKKTYIYQFIKNDDKNIKELK